MNSYTCAYIIFLLLGNLWRFGNRGQTIIIGSGSIVVILYLHRVGRMYTNIKVTLSKKCIVVVRLHVEFRLPELPGTRRHGMYTNFLPNVFSFSGFTHYIRPVNVYKIQLKVARYLPPSQLACNNSCLFIIPQRSVFSIMLLRY